MSNIKIDFSNVIGKIKPMHGTGAGPRQGGATLGIDTTAEFKEIGVPFSRLHDIEGAYGANQFVDIHCVFPDFDADVDNPESYNFKPTDYYLDSIIKAGTKVFYRLGETIDHYPKQLFVRPPKDNLKWAKICEHIIRHYNEGWADGFNWNIEYWEIWNEPDNSKMWTGSFDEFYNLYVTTARHLKKCFPNLKIGGYSASGFYTESRPLEECGAWFKTLVPYTIKFFERLSKETEKVPMDFFSWHCYADRPEEIRIFAEYAQKLLQEYGYAGIESILTEYNAYNVFVKVPAANPCYGAELAAGLIVAQNSPVDAVMYYDMRFGRYNGIFARNIYLEIQRLHGFFVMKSFGDLYRLGNQCELTCDIGGVYALAATNGVNNGIMIAVKDFCGELNVQFSDVYNGVCVIEYCYEKPEKELETVKTDSGIKFNIQKDSVYYIKIKQMEN